MRWALVLTLAACGSADESRADFSLTDVAPASPRFGEQVSPGDYLGEVSGWYFGHAN